MTLRLNGSTSGYTEIDAPAVAGSNTITLPTGAGSANQFLKNGATAGSLEFGTATEDASGNLAFNSGYGSSAVAYGCRAWVNFNGTGTVAIRASGNVSSITDNGTGDYTVNFTTALVDANYCLTFGGTGNTGSPASSAFAGGIRSDVALTTSSVRIVTGSIGTGAAITQDPLIVNVAIFR
jgi:hypothetical protein